MFVKRGCKLTYPILDLLAGLCGQCSESHAPNFLHLVSPCQLAAGSDAAILLQQRETERPILLNCCNRVKAKPFAENIQDDAAVVRLNLDGGEFLHCRPRDVATFGC